MAAVFGQVDGIRSTWSAAMFSCRRYKLQSRIQMNFLVKRKVQQRKTHTHEFQLQHCIHFAPWIETLWNNQPDSPSLRGIHAWMSLADSYCDSCTPELRRDRNDGHWLKLRLTSGSAPALQPCHRKFRRIANLLVLSHQVESF